MRVSVKKHQCTLCARVIPVGEEYINQKIKPWDHPDNDGYSTLKAHTYPCYEALLNSADADGWMIPPDGILGTLNAEDLAVVESFERWQR